MRVPGPRFSRRGFLAATGALGLVAFARSVQGAPGRLTKVIPATGERIPAIGMGSWLTFDVAGVPALVKTRTEVLRAFFEAGGGVIDSSPMYGSSEQVIGTCLARLSDTHGLFKATKVWIFSKALGPDQMAHSERLWGTERFDLMQIHNMLNWEEHLETLKDWKAKGRIRYIGITTSHGRRHADMERVIATQPFDFVQFTYNILDREAERRLLPLAQERGLAVIINRPFQGGGLFDRFEDKPLPDWAGEIDCANWAQFFLKFIVSHPAVTCAIPATTRVDHMRENMGAGLGRLPDADLRNRMIRYVESL